MIGTILALDKWEEFRLHVRAALTEGGFSADDIKEIILQQMIYCGVPAANHAFREAGEIVKELGKTSAALTVRRNQPANFGIGVPAPAAPSPSMRFTRPHPMAGFNVRKEMPGVELSQR